MGKKIKANRQPFTPKAKKQKASLPMLSSSLKSSGKF